VENSRATGNNSTGSIWSVALRRCEDDKRLAECLCAGCRIARGRTVTAPIAKTCLSGRLRSRGYEELGCSKLTGPFTVRLTWGERLEQALASFFWAPKPIGLALFILGQSGSLPP